jgi:hypothetical protein
MLPPWAQRISDLLANDPSKSQAELARACGLKQGSVSGWLGKGKPTKMISGDNLVAAATYLCVTPEWIMTGRNNARPSQSQPTRLDPDMVAESYAALSEIYLEELGRPYELVTEPERFVLVCEARSRMSHSLSAKDERMFAIKVSAIVRQTGAELHGSSDGVPSEGPNKGHVAR